MAALSARFKRSSMALAVGYLVFVGLAVGGCTPWATYPPIEGAAGISRPGLSPIPELMAEAIWHAYDLDGAEGELIINLPEGTPWHVYDRVIKRLRMGRPMLNPGERAYHVTAVRVRTIDAEVDVLRPRGDSSELVTVSLDIGLGGPTVERARPWRFEVETPPPYYQEVGGPPSEVVEGRDGLEDS